MKKTTLFLFTICLFAVANLAAQTEFITTWKTDNPGFSSNTSVKISINPDFSYNYNVDWENDGIIDDTNVTGSITHDYGTTGTYTVVITGVFPSLQFRDTSSHDNNKLLSVEQWGTNQWLSMNRGFLGCENVVFNASDSPDLSLVTDMSYMFNGAKTFNSPLNNWDVSSVTNMKSIFYGAEDFDQPLYNWNVSNVTNMSGVFSTTKYFNQDISSWNVSNVMDMSGMFTNAKSFNGDISNWNVSNVTSMSSMFFYATDFNQNISNWNISNVTNIGYMFYLATSFDQNLGDWDISSVTNMGSMFKSAGLSTANYDNTLIGWNTLDTGETQIPTGITFNGGNSKYCNGEAARTSLNSTYNWTFTDGGKNSGCTTLSAQNFNTETLSLFPNPVKSSFTIRGLNDVNNIQIVNLQGQLVQEVINYKTQSIAIDTLANGMYFVNINTPNGSHTIKIIKE
ncbi:hypothetical protein APS56_08880 [Pseudalgibacter alginicilyticus]|uniref:Secretion system C-terminal sorting domain-containing protein n=1 Tax=Pseudalgibacter alginicilyticus TaxID=1736674 RepID=A0A0N7HYH0_9FLAO|nr:BspA family leucine-rich repeat surface protein [Pseudalgibacter alginicilyticus]ALJ05230.1 hypothetical protein APS56_08880 [Pseudalgibacter alginicilyticus]